MEAPTAKQGESNRDPEDEGTWRAHVAYAANFQGSNAEYCRRNQIDHRQFRSYKRKFGATKAGVRKLKAFVKVESLASTPGIRKSHLPDPYWTAELITALMAARE